MAVTLIFSGSLTKSDPQDNPVLIVGQPKNLSQITFETIKIKLEPRVSAETYQTAVNALHPSPTDSTPLWLNNATVAALPIKCSRHNTPSSAHSLSKIVKSCLVGGDEYVVVVCEKKDVVASAAAIARVLPLFSAKSGQSSTGRKVMVEFLLVGPEKERSLLDSDISCLHSLAFSVRLSAKIVDAPCADMHTDIFLDEIRKVGEELDITPMIIQGEELKERGFGGIYNVGKAAVNAPALAVLSHKPEGAKRTIAWVGKGIVFDTGGLCIKAKAGMCGMKRDCGGAAAILGAFYLAVKSNIHYINKGRGAGWIQTDITLIDQIMGFQDNLHAVLCLAENAVGPSALRPDDIITLYSGKTVEINNTDAEGRLVLGDGVAYANKDLKADIVVDMATLTGAQGIATGKYHASIVTNNEDWEVACVHAGKTSGDLVHPMPYSPELHYSEFSSTLADMKNSVADRSNCQVSCAGLFIASHLGFEFPGVWLHIDMASPVHNGERATGYGVALLNALFGGRSLNPLLQSVAPSISYEAFSSETKADGAKKMKLNNEIE